jgi:predicted RNA-binding Zn ribbon-like protein
MVRRLQGNRLACNCGYTHGVPAVPLVPLSWLVTFINEYADQPRDEARESGQPYPDLAGGENPAEVSQLSAVTLAAIASTLWPVFAATGSAQKAAALNRLLRGADLTPGVTPEGQLSWTTRHRATASALTAGCAVALLRAVHSVGWEKLGTCAGSDCIDVYIDHRGPTPRRYCSETCLNRARVRAYRKRHKAG